MYRSRTPIVAPVSHEVVFPPQSGQPDSSHWGALLAGQQLAATDAMAKQMAIYGGIGVLTMSAISAAVTGASFAAYRKSGSVLMPALISGLGSLATGGILLWLLIRSAAAEADSRIVYAAAGAQMAR